MIFKQKFFLKKLMEKNFYASKSKYPILNLTMIYNNPKSGNKKFMQAWNFNSGYFKRRDHNSF